MHGPEEWRSRLHGCKAEWVHRIRPIGSLHTNSHVARAAQGAVALKPAPEPPILGLTPKFPGVPLFGAQTTMHAAVAPLAWKSPQLWLALVCACVLALAPLGATAESAAAEHDPPVAKKSRKTRTVVVDDAAPAAAKPDPAEPAAKPRKDAKGGAQAQSADREPAESPGRRRASRAILDPMDVVRERLAQRLGAAQVDNGQAVRVAAQSPVPTTPAKVVATHPAPKKTAAKTAQGHAVAGHWSYQGDAGPQSWGKLKPEFIKCTSGERQSPIDIRDGMKLQLDPVQFDYRPSAFRVIDNGHTVQVNVAGGNTIEVIGRRYSLVQFHFHRPSEERVEGRQFEMVAHLVHKDMEGRLAVVAVLLDQGSAHPLVQTVWNNLPLEKGEEVPARAMLDLNALLPAERNYFTYMGSLTTPPCSEGVLWMVMKQPVQVSLEQIGIFARLYPMNARPIQSASGRLIKESN